MTWTPARAGLKATLLIVVLSLIGAWLLVSLPPKPAKVPRVHPPYRVVVLGFDGMDADLTERWMAEGLLPNLRRLALANEAQGLKGYSALMSTNPSESPVSWSSMITGQNPGKTNVYDFLRRYPETYDIDNAMVDTSEPAKFAFDTIPYKLPNFQNFREGDPVWKLTNAAGIRTVVLEAPVSFPPDEIPGSHLLCGLGVGDLRGTMGTYTYYTTDPRKALGGGFTEFGGRLKQVFADDEGAVEFDILGPPNRIKNPGGKDSTLPVDLTLAAVLRPTGPGTASLEITQMDGSVTATPLTVSTWSDFIEVAFPVTEVVTVHGIFKCRLTRYDFSDPGFPQIDLYISPLNFHPAKPPVPISFPAGWTKTLSDKFGLFKTVGWPSETWGLNEHVLDDEAFLQDIDITQTKWEEMLFATLEEDTWDFCFAVTQQTDHVSHMFWRYFDPEHPAYNAENAKNPRYRDAILQAYQRADKVVGRVMAEHLQDERTILYVVSDHGFNMFRRSVNINRWLIDHGYMQLQLPAGVATAELSTAQLFAGDQFFADVDWENTQAYAMGLGQIYLNLAGREGQGIVTPGEEAERIKAEISAGLRELKDTDGTQVVLDVYDGTEIYHGHAMEQAPDLVMGFADGYRVSWQTSLGGAPAEIIEDNEQAWSGDHCSFDPSTTMGICFTNWSIDKPEPSVLDIAPTVLTLLGLPVPDLMDGGSLTKRMPQ